MVVKVDLENFELAPRHFQGEPELGRGSIRFSLGRYNTEADIDITLNVLPEIIAKLAAMSPYDRELSAQK